MHFQADIENAVGQAFKDMMYRARVKFRPWLHRVMLETLQETDGGMLLLETYLLGRPTPLAPGEEYKPEEKAILAQRFAGLQMRANNEWGISGSLDDYFAPTPEKDAARARELEWATSDTLESRLAAMKWRVEGGVTMAEQVQEMEKREKEYGDPEDNVYLQNIAIEKSLQELRELTQEIRQRLEDPRD